MTTTMTDEQILEEAKKRVKAKKDFYGHLGAWIVVNIVLLIIWATVGDRHEVWFVFPGYMGRLCHASWPECLRLREEIGIKRNRKRGREDQERARLNTGLGITPHGRHMR